MTEAAQCSSYPFSTATPSTGQPYLTFTICPGAVRYVEVSDFIAADLEAMIRELTQFEQTLQIRTPYGEYREKRTPYDWNHELKFYEIDQLSRGMSAINRLRVLHAMAEAFSHFGMPAWVYYCFHRQLALTDFAFDKCVESWVAETLGNNDLAESFLTSSAHLVVRYG